MIKVLNILYIILILDALNMSNLLKIIASIIWPPSKILNGSKLKINTTIFIFTNILNWLTLIKFVLFKKARNGIITKQENGPAKKIIIFFFKDTFSILSSIALQPKGVILIDSIFTLNILAKIQWNNSWIKEHTKKRKMDPKRLNKRTKIK